MNGQPITPDFLYSQLRLALVAILAYGGGAHWFTPEAAGLYLTLFTTLGPMVVPWVWSIISNLGTTRVSTSSAAAVVADVEKTDPAAANRGATVATATAVKVLLFAFIIMSLAWTAPTFAQIPKPKPQITFPYDPMGLNKPGAQTGDIGYDLLKALDAKLLPDLQYALLLAKATGSNVTAGCYQAWIDMITIQQTAVKDSTGAEIATPDPHLVTDFERMVELRNALQPDSKFMVACSPVANMVKQDVIKFMGIVISGGAGLATMVPGL